MGGGKGGNVVPLCGTPITTMLDSKWTLSYLSGNQRRCAPTTGQQCPKRAVIYSEISKSAQEREQLVKEYEASGKSQHEFCEERGIKLTTFKGWFYKKKRVKGPGFAEVAVAMPETGPGEVIFPSGVRVSIRGTMPS